FQERGDGPDLGIGHAGGAEAGHAGHADAIFDDPKELTRLQAPHDVLQIGWARVEALGELRPLGAWAAMAVDAASCREGLCAGLYRRRVVQVRRRRVGGVAVDRGLADL